MPTRNRAKILAFIVASVLSVLNTALALASDGQVPFPK
jgi:hypothetical protein